MEKHDNHYKSYQVKNRGQKFSKKIYQTQNIVASQKKTINTQRYYSPSILQIVGVVLKIYFYHSMIVYKQTRQKRYTAIL